MAKRLVIFDVDTLADLLTHFTDGEVPLGSKVIQVMASAYLQEWVALVVENDSWENTPFEAGDGYGGQMPYHLRYAAGKLTQWREHGTEPITTEAPEAPKRQ